MAAALSPNLPLRKDCPQGRFRRALGRVGAVTGLLVVFAGATAVGAGLHLGTPPARRIAIRVLNDVLHSSLAGEVRVGALTHLDLHRITVRDATALDPRGNPVLSVHGVEARFNALAIAWTALRGSSDLAITLSSVSVDHANVLIEQGPSTALTLEETFQPRAFGPPEPTDPRARPLRLTLEQVHVGSAWIHGQIAEAQALDAEVHALRGSFALEPDGIALALEPAAVLERRVLPTPIAGTLEARLRTRGDAMALEGGFQGRVGSVDATVRASMDGDRVVATADIPRLTPEGLGSILPNPPLTRPITVQVRADGTLPMLGVEARIAEVDAPQRAISIVSELDLEGPVQIQADVTTAGLDAQLFSARAPLSAIDARARAQITLGEGLPRVIADLHTEPTRILDQLVPTVEAHVELDRGVLHGSLTVEEEGAPMEARFALTEDQRARFELRGAVPSLHAVPRIAGPLGGAVDGSAALQVQGSFVGGVLDARAHSAFSISPGKTQVALRRGQLAAHVHGPVEALTVNASLQGDDLSASGRAFERVTAKVEGPLLKPRVSATLAGGDRFISASLEVDAEAQAARRIRVDLRRGDASAAVAIARVESRAAGPRLDGISIHGDGIGEVKGSIALGAGGITGAIHGEALDLGRLADLAGLPLSIGGIASFDVAMRRGKKGPEAHVALELEDGRYEDYSGLSAHLTTTLDGEDLRADGLVRLIATAPDGERQEGEACGGAIATIQLQNAKARLRGPLMDARTWNDLRGQGNVLAEDLDLRCLAQRSPIPLPDEISGIAGRVSAALQVVRDPAARFPSVHDLLIKTHGLTVRGALSPTTRAPTWMSTALNVAISGDFDGETGRTRGGIAVLDDQVLLDLSAAATLDLPALLGDPARRARALRETQIAGHLAIPRRSVESFGSLPSFVRDQLPAMSGEVQLDVYAAGTPAAPRVAVRAMGFGLEQDASRMEPARAGQWAFPLNLDSAVFYDSHKGQLDAFVSHAGAELAVVKAEAKAELAALLARKPDQSIPWSGGVHATIRDLPIGQLPYLADHGVHGALRGTIAIEGLNERPRIAVDLEALDLQMSPDLFFEQATVALHVGGDGAAGDKATIAANFVAQDGGRLEASADVGIRWKAGAVPMVDPARGADAKIDARRFRLAALQPLLAETVSRLDGYLDGRLALDWARFGEARNGRIEGALRVTEGVVEIPTMGQELRDAELTLIANPAGVLRIDKISAQGRSGSFHGSGLVRYEKGNLLSGRAELEIPNGQDVPITLEGVPLGEARGRVSLEVKTKGDDLDVAVKVPSFHLALPPSLGKSAQDLEPNENITVLQPIAAPEEPPPEEQETQAAPSAQTRVVIGVDLGDIQIEGKGIDVTLTDYARSRLKIVLGEETQVGGGIKVVRGKVEVLGKVFEIEPDSLVNLRPADTSNPFLNVTARWDAPEGTRVFIDYIGDLEPITPEKIRFRSDPQKSKQEIISLILFGPDYEQGTIAGGPSTGQSKSAAETAAGTAATVGSSLASEQITQILNGIAPLQGLQVKLATSDSGSLRTSLGYKIGRNITATASFGDGGGSTSSSSGSAAGQSSASTALGLEWRFRPHWSLRASLGLGASGAGAAAASSSPSTALDLLWTKRY